MSEKRLEVLEELAANLIAASQLGEIEWIRTIVHQIENELHDIRLERLHAELKREAV